MIKSVKAGQTIYVPMYDFSFENTGFVGKIRVMRDSYPIPMEGCVIEAAPRWYINQRLARNTPDARVRVFSSRRKCESALKAEGVRIE